MSLGLGQILIVLVLVLIIFGAGKIPRVMGDLAKGLKAFKEGLKEDETSSSSNNTSSHPSISETTSTPREG